MPDYFTYDEFRALPDCSGDKYTDDEIDAAEGFFVAIVEREIGEPFIPRVVTETLDGNGTGSLVLGTPHADVTAVTVGGVTVDVSGLTAQSGVLRYVSSDYYSGTPWVVGASNVVVTYTAGRYATPPADIKDAVMWATKDRLEAHSSQNGVNVRQTTMTTDYGTTSYVLPGAKQPTGYPELDALIASYARSVPSLGFA